MSKIRVGTRGSELARTQTLQFTASLQQIRPELEIELVIIKTEGDGTTTPLSQSKTPGVFVSALRDALVQHRVDVIVHSMKDLPAKPFAGITTAAIPPREDVRDALVSQHNLSLRELPPGALVGTSSPRRAASIRAIRPDLRVESIRGNVDSRIQKVRQGEYQATLLAVAGLNRIGRQSEVAEAFEASQLVPAPGQGALSVECRSADADLIATVGELDHRHTRITTTAERSVLVGINAGCATAIGAFAQLQGEQLTLIAELADEQTGESVRVSVQDQVQDSASAYLIGMRAAAQLRETELGKRVLA